MAHSFEEAGIENPAASVEDAAGLPYRILAVVNNLVVIVASIDACADDGRVNDTFPPEERSSLVPFPLGINSAITSPPAVFAAIEIQETVWRLHGRERRADLY